MVLEKYTLVVAEKPDAARRIAAALDTAGKPKENRENGTPFFSAYRSSNIIVVPALGHLYTVTSTKKEKQTFPIFDYQWVPLYQADRKASKTKTWLKVISKLAENAKDFVDACDFDIEGSIIGYCILKYACQGKEKTAKRMKYSTLTNEELVESYTNLLPRLDFAQIEAGLARHEADWLYGINLSRALTGAVKRCSGQYATLSTGRVQGPTLNFLKDKEDSIQAFVATPYWTLTAKILIDEFTFDFDYLKNPIQTKEEAKTTLDSCKTKEGKIEKVAVNEFLQKPPVPFDLGTLQSEAYSHLRYSPMTTSKIAQKLYVNALISYPRTSSQKLPANINYKNILKKLAKTNTYKTQANKLLAKPSLKPHEGNKTDPAHPAIYPTGNLPEKALNTQERNIFDLIVKRFLSVFADAAVKQSIQVEVSISGNMFGLRLTRTLSEGWIEYYKPYVKAENVFLPPLVEGQIVKVKKVTMKENYTKPPARYNPKSLLKKMEQEELGTKATRAATIQTLYDRKYVQGSDSMTITDLGSEVIEVLRKYCPNVISPQLTRSIEEKMDKIQKGENNKESVLSAALEILKPVTKELKENEVAIGTQLNQALKKAYLNQKILGTCPRCKTGKLVILNSKKTGKRFVGCTNYFEGKCGAAFPLPQTGIIKPLSTPCKNCGYPVVQVLLKPKHPWRLCINTQCPAKTG
ncbi:MAG: DNA topoisomerase I [Candidatus Bathyarchaeota archaeon]|nr:DNA topoisomerase I [Candidatus Bathyarchaeota archaeon]